MSSFWEDKYKNTEKSIAFLQATHAEILKGLHDEIELLQKQCSDYAFRLSLNASTAKEKDEFDQKFKSYNVEYKKKDSLINEQKKLIEERNKNIKSLQERIKSLEKKIESEADTKDQLIKKLNHQLETQSSQIASLTFQLHYNNKSKKSNQQQLSDSREYNSSTHSYNNAQNNEAPSTSNNNNLSQSGATVASILSSSHSNKKPSSPKISKNKTNKTGLDTTLNNHQAILLDENSLNNFELNIPKSATNTNKSDQIGKQSFDSENSTETYVDTNALHEPTAAASNRFQMRRSPRSTSNSAHSERSLTPPTQKILPPVIKFKPFENVAPVPDPKPFLQSAASILHPKSKKDLLQRRTLISLPPIKPFELNQLAVESPLKGAHNNQSLLNGSSSNIPKNNSNN